MATSLRRRWLRVAYGPMGIMKKKNNLSWLSSQASDKLHAVQPKFNVAILAQCMAI